MPIEKSLHWADQLADKIIERAHREKRVANVKCQQTPSGGKHIGNLNDVLRAYFPYKAVLERGEKCTFVHTTDDRDPLKDIPARIADLEANWHPIDKYKPGLLKYLGRPLCRVPDPFGCCESYSAHFTTVWMDGLYALGVKPTLYSVNDLYKQGKFDKYIETVFKNKELVGSIISKLQATKQSDYIPFDAICPNCGVLSPIDDFDIPKRQVHLTCGGKLIKAKKAEGCGEENWVAWSEGKLQWRFEWPALMCIFNTTFEPFGKDHAEGSWKSVLEIMPKVFDQQPPIPFVYEFFLVNGQKMSASKGNVYIVQDMLKVLEPEVFNFFYVKRPEKQRDLDLSKLFQLVDEFDEAERVYFGKGSETSENREENAKRMYDLCAEHIPAKMPVRVSYAFAASLSQLFDDQTVLQKLVELNHLDGATEGDRALALKRIALARNWVNQYAGPENKLTISTKPQAVHHLSMLDHSTLSAVKQFAVLLRFTSDLQAQATGLREISEENKVPIARLYAALYKVLIGKEKGPKLLGFINAIGREKVADLLE